MAIARSLLATCLLLYSLLVIAYANDYGGYDSSKTPAYDYGAKPEAEQKTNYETKPVPNGEEKPEYGTKPVNQQQPEKEEKPDYGTKQNFYIPQLEDKEKAMLEESEKLGYSTKPQPEEEEKPEYGTKPSPSTYKPQPEETEKTGYSTKPVYQTQPEKEEQPEEYNKPEGVESLIFPLVLKGLFYVKQVLLSYSRYNPFETHTI